VLSKDFVLVATLVGFWEAPSSPPGIITRTVVEKVRVSWFRLNLPPTPPPLTSYKLLPLRPKKMTILHFNDVYNVEPRAKEGVKCCSCVHCFAFPAENLNLKFRNHSLISGQKCERMIAPDWIYTLHIQGQTPYTWFFLWPENQFLILPQVQVTSFLGLL